MEESGYGLRVRMPVAYEAALERTMAALKAEGFGVVTTIDMQQTLRAKLESGLPQVRDSRRLQPAAREPGAPRRT